MLLLWKPLPERQLQLLVCRQKPIYGRFLSEHQQMGTALDEHRAFESDRWSDRQRSKEATERKEGRKMNPVWTAAALSLSLSLSGQVQHRAFLGLHVCTVALVMSAALEIGRWHTLDITAAARAVIKGSRWILISTWMEPKQDVATDLSSRASCPEPTGASGGLLCCHWNKKKSNPSNVESPTCKCRHTFTQTGITLWSCPQSNCKSDYGSSPQTSFSTARDKVPFWATFLFTFAVR